MQQLTVQFKNMLRRLPSAPKHMIARILMGLIMLLVGLSYLYEPEGGVLSRFVIYGSGVPTFVAIMFIACGLIKLIFSRYEFSTFALFPNYLYVGMLLHLAVKNEVTWTGFLYTAGFVLIATIASMRGVVHEPTRGVQ